MEKEQDKQSERNAIEPARYQDYRELREEVLSELLSIERARLAAARDMEQARSIVFPETTVIVKDIQRLLVALDPASKELDTKDETDDLDLDLSTI